VSKRSAAEKVPTQGIFVGAKVVRGPDWDRGDEDGEFFYKQLADYFSSAVYVHGCK
jgi:hypothetical protein